MPHYIRFLKPPQQVQAHRGNLNINCLITITNDLGDDLLWESVPLTAILLVEDAQTSTPLVKTELVWQPGARELPISFGPVKSVPRSSEFRVYVAMGPNANASAGSLVEFAVPPVIAAWSARFGGASNTKAQKLVGRKFRPGVGPPLAIWEETGESIARHLWDAALATTVALQKTTHDGRWPECLSSLFMENQQDGRPPGRKRQIIELGTGCGMVGLYIAQTFTRTSVLLTDLEDARDIVQLNLSQTSPASGSNATFQVLDWDEGLPVNVQQMKPDMVMVSDCTYNADSFAALTQTLSRLADISPNMLVLVTYKERHESEKAFFQCMTNHGFAVRGQSIIPLPDLTAEDGLQNVHIFAFSRDTAASSRNS
ncbi:hypothetical protein KEM56_001161 [Ascosphaera pollenicola]|nr:hypothetical protein KEM56_001161 [Ascosphaera pollenicola]